jgi:peptidoglycan/xylan/chitin deacetylase (PgdA/CDA1 family)
MTAQRSRPMRAILTYHSIDDSGSPISISVSEFRRHVEWLAAAPVRVVTVPELLHVPAGADALAITFDDALQNFAQVAWPLLSAHGFPATVFVPTAHVGSTNAWGGETPRGLDRKVPVLRLMTWDDLARAADDGATVASHCRHHVDLRRLDSIQLEDELLGAAADIRTRTGRSPDGFAYPFGATSPASVGAVRRAYDWACTTVLRPLAEHPDRHLLPRLDAYYLRRGLDGWGSVRLRARLAGRRCARDLRRLLAQAIGPS